MIQRFSRSVEDSANQEHPLVGHVYIPDGATVETWSVAVRPTQGTGLTINGGDAENPTWKPGWNDVTLVPEELCRASLVVNMTLNVPEK